MVVDNGMDMYVLILPEGMKKSPYEFKRSACIVRPMVLVLSRKFCSADGLGNLILPCLDEYPMVEVVLMAKIMN